MSRVKLLDAAVRRHEGMLSAEERERKERILRRFNAARRELENRPEHPSQEGVIQQVIKSTKIRFHMAILKLEMEYKAGNRNALNECIRLCCEYVMPPPEWASQAYLEGRERVARREAKWDDVLGKPYKGKHLKDMRPDEDKQTIYREVTRLQSEDRPTDTELFSEVGKRYGSPSGKEIRTIYYDIEHKRVERYEGIQRGIRIARKATDAVLARSRKPKR